MAVSVTREGDRVVLTVQDTGIGIPPGETDRVFERFYRVDKSHSKEIGGTGLGLSIVKHAAAYHDAKIQLDSQLGRGTRVRVLFPLEPEGGAAMMGTIAPRRPGPWHGSMRLGLRPGWWGGCVRDMLLGCAPKDYDLATSARPEETKAVFQGRRSWKPASGTAR